MQSKILGVIGGSGLYNLGVPTEKLVVETPYGAPSSAIQKAVLHGTTLYFIARHGEGHTISPSELNSRANIFALKKLGVKVLLSVSAVGSLRQEITPGDFVLPEQYFEDKFDRHHSSLRVINYPDQAQEPLPGQLRAGAHSDYGFLTILRSESSSGGLQAQHRNGAWIDVPTIAGAFVTNIGDAMMRWTNDRWISTVHRVVNPPATGRQSSRRQSIPFFHNPNIDAVIECLEVFCDDDHPPKYGPMTYGEYADLKYRQAHGERG